MRFLAAFVMAWIGAGLGWLSTLMPVRPVGQALAAAVAGWVAGTIGGVVLLVALMMWHLRSTTVGSFGVAAGPLADIILGIPAILLLVAFGRLGLKWVGRADTDQSVTRRTVLWGALSAALGTLWMTFRFQMS